MGVAKLPLCKLDFELQLGESLPCKEALPKHVRCRRHERNLMKWSGNHVKLVCSHKVFTEELRDLTHQRYRFYPQCDSSA